MTDNSGLGTFNERNKNLKWIRRNLVRSRVFHSLVCDFYLTEFFKERLPDPSFYTHLL